MEPKYVPLGAYTIGWVCALPIELAAASGMMDEEYEPLPPQPNDSNIYSYGRIGGHNIVIACLPAGQMGTNSAATVASQMRSSFPAMRFGVLVGIGGGVPNLEDDKDIRLGDVVISQPFGQHGGVIQYDFGKTGADGRLARTGSLNAPPTILLNALSKLQANDVMDKMKFHKYLSELLSSKPKFASPGPKKDVLYEADSVHVGGATCKKCHPEDQVDRIDRMTTDPSLFFGNIASGNQVMKDGKTRDKHSEELGGVLCFEMEAAGLMNNFPCLVIRGICDYADAHKNKQWQPYAAATAAALAKELLCTIPSTMSTAKQAPVDPIQKPLFLVPFRRNNNFVGRKDILRQLLKRTPPSANEYTCQRTAIVGPRGIGKTQVAIEAAYRVFDAYPDCSVFWVPAINLGKTFNTAFKSALEQEDINSWLLIIDNADDVDFGCTSSGLASYVPSSRRGSVLLTTRNSFAVARDAGTFVLPLSKMDTEEGVELLHSGLTESQIECGQSTTQLLENLTYLPMAIRLASAHLGANPAKTISQYLKSYVGSNKVRITRLSKDIDDLQDPVAATWLISFEIMARYNPLAAKHLKFLCFLADKDVPTALLPPGDNHRQTRDAINTLQAYAFIQLRKGGESLDVHHLVRLVMRNWLKEQHKEKQQATDTMDRLSAEFTRPEAEWSVYIPHVEEALKDWRLSTNGKGLWNLWRKLGKHNQAQGKYAEAERIHRRVLALKQEVLKPDDPAVIDSLKDLQSTLRNWSFRFGRDDRDKEHQKEASALGHEIWRLENPDSLISLYGGDSWGWI